MTDEDRNVKRPEAASTRPRGAMPGQLPGEPGG